MNNELEVNDEPQKDIFSPNAPVIDSVNVWNIENPKIASGYICRMDNSFIKMCYWDGVKWKDMWQETLDGTVRLWMKIPNENSCAVGNIKDAMGIVCNELKNDDGYYYSWKANIAMAFYDEFYNTSAVKDSFSKEMIHEIANNASDNFLKLLIKL